MSCISFHCFLCVLGVTCGQPLNFTNATVNSWSPYSGSVTYKSDFTIVCDNGFWFSSGVYSQHIECKKTGKWSYSGLICTCK